MKSGSELHPCTSKLLWMDSGTQQIPAGTGCISHNKNPLKTRHFRPPQPAQNPFAPTEEKQKIQRVKRQNKKCQIHFWNHLLVLEGNSDLEINISHSSGYLWWWFLPKVLTCSSQGPLGVPTSGILRILGSKQEVLSSCLVRTLGNYLEITWKLLGMTLVIHTCKSL